MAVVFTHDGELRVLNAAKPYLETLQLRLFVNDYTPTRTSVLDDFTEATFPGYAAVVVGPMAGPYTNGDGKAEVSGETVTFERSSGAGDSQTVYGYFLTDPDDGEVVYAERGPGSGQLLDTAGDTYSVSPRVTGRSEEE